MSAAEEKMKLVFDRLDSFIDKNYQGHYSSLTRAANLPNTMISRWKESGSTTLKSLFKLEDGGISISWLLSGRGSRYANNDVGKHLMKLNNPDEAKDDMQHLTKEELIDIINDYKSTWKSLKFSLKKISNY